MNHTLIRSDRLQLQNLFSENLMVTTPNERLIRSTPGSPTALIMGSGVQQQSMDGQPGSFEVIGSAENLVGRVSSWRGYKSRVNNSPLQF